MAAGGLFYGVDLPSADRIPGLILVLSVGAAAFCALGLAVISFIPNADAAPAVVNGTIHVMRETLAKLGEAGVNHAYMILYI